MLLVTVDQHAGRSVTGVNAVVRGRFMELFGKVHFGKLQADDLFVFGVFSLFVVLFDQPMEKLLDPLSIAATMRDAPGQTGWALHVVAVTRRSRRESR